MTGFHPDDPGLFRPYRPWLLKIANVITYGLDEIFGRIMTSDDEKLVKKACKLTNLNDFGDDTFREPLKILCGITRNGPRMTAYGRYITRKDLLRRLINKLKIQADFKKFPEILEGEIQKPIFILGLPRTGTTLLQRTLAQDPANRTLKPWEMIMPSPPPSQSTYDTDPRIKKIEKVYDFVYYAVPALKAIHKIDATSPEECVLLMANGLISEHFTMGVGAHPDYLNWLYIQDLLDTYKFHRKQLQLLQWKCPADRWVLKSPFHIYGLKWLVQVYPDARIIQVHRDPLEVLPSAVSLVTVTTASVFEHVDPEVIGKKTPKVLASLLFNAIKTRSDIEMKKDNRVKFLDVHYKDLVTDPINAVQQIYRKLGIDFTSEAEQRMRRYLEKNPQHKHGKHQYTLEMFKLNEDALRRQFQFYYEHFGVA